MKQSSGFTLIELSIVLVIIGLIIGGILTGQNLIDTATIRAQLSQVEKYNTAVRTFQSKYGYLPGDIPNPYASQFGLQSRGSYPGEGDGDGILGSNCNNNAASLTYTNNFCAGELAVFWEDLSTANLIDATILGTDKVSGQYPSTTVYTNNPMTLTSTPGIKDWLPAAKIGTSMFMYVYSDSGTNYFGLSSVDYTGVSVYSPSNPGITVQQAYNMDKKVDDGLPTSGSVTTCYLNLQLILNGRAAAAGGGNLGTTQPDCNPWNTATNYEPTDCYDNAVPGSAAGTGGVNGATQTYALKNAGTANCALSFRFQ